MVQGLNHTADTWKRYWDPHCLRPSPLPFPRIRCHASPAPARPPGQARVDDAEEPMGGPGKWIGDPELGCQVRALGAHPPGVGWALAGVRTSGLQF